MGVALYPIHKIQREQNLNNHLRIISGGRFVEKKGFKDLVNAANLLQKNNSNSIIQY